MGGCDDLKAAYFGVWRAKKYAAGLLAERLEMRKPMPTKKPSQNAAKSVSEPAEALERLAQRGSGDDSQAVRLVQREGDEAPPILFYDTDKGGKLELRYTDGELWFTQAQMAAAFGVDVRTVNEHIQNFRRGGELDEATIRKFRIVRLEGQREVSREIEHYGLDVAFYVGYRVNSQRGALFRRIATDILVRVAKYGYFIDVERLKAPDDPGIVDQLKETIRDIRASYQNAYREVRRIVSLTQDYDPTSDLAASFYARMENKLLFLATSMTAPEIIVERADASKPDMGLTYFTGKRGPTQRDAKIANNYLAEGEARVKNRATVMLLDYFEEQADQGRLVTMSEAEEKLDGFIKFNGWPLLDSAGRVTRAEADRRAVEQQKLFIAKD